MSKKLLVAAALTCLLGTPASATAIAVFGPGPLDVVALSAQALVFNFTDMPDVGGTPRSLGAFLELAGTGITGNGLNVLLYEDLNAAGTPFATYTNWAGNVSGLAGFWSDQTGSFTLQATGDSAMFISLITAGYEFNASGSFHQNWFDLVPLSSTVPLPAALPLFASGLVGLGWLSRRRRKQLQAG